MWNKINIEPNLVIKKYEELKNLKSVAKSFNVSLRPIKRILKENNIVLTNRRFNVNHDYFKVIDSEEKAYWLGFLYADGCVRKTKTGSQVVLKLSDKDEEHLVKFKNSLSSEHIISHSINITKTKKGTESKSLNCIIRINSNQLVNDLILHGCTPKKTFTIESPMISEEYVRHFLRGYYDGDGNFFYSEKTKLSVVTIVCASKNFRKFIINTISKLPNIGNIHEDENRYTIKITNIVGIVEFLSYIYDGSNIELERKKKYYEKYKEYRRNIESDYNGKLRGSYVKST